MTRGTTPHGTCRATSGYAKTVEAPGIRPGSPATARLSDRAPAIPRRASAISCPAGTAFFTALRPRACRRVSRVVSGSSADESGLRAAGYRSRPLAKPRRGAGCPVLSGLHAYSDAVGGVDVPVGHEGVVHRDNLPLHAQSGRPAACGVEAASQGQAIHQAELATDSDPEVIVPGLVDVHRDRPGGDRLGQATQVKQQARPPDLKGAVPLYLAICSRSPVLDKESKLPLIGTAEAQRRLSGGLTADWRGYILPHPEGP